MHSTVWRRRPRDEKFHIRSKANICNQTSGQALADWRSCAQNTSGICISLNKIRNLNFANTFLVLTLFQFYTFTYFLTASISWRVRWSCEVHGHGRMIPADCQQCHNQVTERRLSISCLLNLSRTASPIPVCEWHGQCSLSYFIFINIPLQFPQLPQCWDSGIECIPHASSPCSLMGCGPQ